MMNWIGPAALALLIGYVLGVKLPQGGRFIPGA